MSEKATITKLTPSSSGGVKAVTSEVTLKKVSKKNIVDKIKANKKESMIAGAVVVALLVGAIYWYMNEKKKREAADKAEQQVVGARKAISALL